MNFTVCPSRAARAFTRRHNSLGNPRRMYVPVSDMRGLSTCYLGDVKIIMRLMKHPMQPIEWDDEGVIRFKRNVIVRFLLDWASERGMDLNGLQLVPASSDDWTQFMQLIGYSVSGAGDVPGFSRTVLAKADVEVALMVELEASKSRKRRK